MKKKQKNKKNKLALVSEADLSLVDSNSLNGKQLKVLLKRTPKQYIKTRPAKGGGTWEYVTGGYVKKCLNLMFGWDWDFEIIDEKIFFRLIHCDPKFGSDIILIIVVISIQMIWSYIGNDCYMWCKLLDSIYFI